MYNIILALWAGFLGTEICFWADNYTDATALGLMWALTTIQCM